MWNAQRRVGSEPIRHVCSMDTTDKFAKTAVLLRENFIADIARRNFLRGRHWLIDQLDEDLGGGQRVLDCRQSPRVKVAEAMGFLLRAILQTGRLVLLQEPAERTTGFVKNVQNGLVEDKL